jgi:O-antigen ligase
MVMLMAALVLSGSRTGLLGLSCLVAWGLLDRRLPGATRLLLGMTPLMAAVAWWATQALIEFQGLPTGASAHLSGSAGGDISSSRFAIWRNTWTLIEQQPWTGVGWGHFNIAWSLTPMSPRPPAFFDHAHNLPLHLMVEWGIPLGGAVILGLLALLVQAARHTWALPRQPGNSASAHDALCRRSALVMLVIVGLHSLLEYPLWYAYLGLPALLALLVSLGIDHPWHRAARWQALLLMAGGGLLVVAAASAYSDYQRIRAIYEPGSRAGTLSSRIAQGAQATWFADHAHYALATTVRPIPQQPWTDAMSRAFERAPHVLLDPRLMMAWADALASRDGPDDRDRARFIAARVREFNSPAAQAWLQACEDPQATASHRFVCETPQKTWTWRDFMPSAPIRP